MSHKAKDCFERPRKRGAKLTGTDMRPDEFIKTAELDFEGKRDRWAGQDAEEYKAVLESWKEPPPKEAENDVSSEEEEDADLSKPKIAKSNVSNLRLREDTAKYLKDLNSDLVSYNPKTRSLRDLETESVVKEDLEYPTEHFSWDRKRPGSSSKSTKEELREIPDKLQ